jgi:hypothetical protein
VRGAVDLAASAMYDDNSVKNRMSITVSCLERQYQPQEGMFCCSLENSVFVCNISVGLGRRIRTNINNGTTFKEKVPCRKGS